MFEALFILTTIDSGTRVGRFLLQEFLGRVYRRSRGRQLDAGGSIATLIMVVSWGYFIYTGQIGTIWPMFGVANQLLGVRGAGGGDHDPDQHGQVRYTWVTLVPLAFLGVNTLYGGFLNIRDNYWPLAIGPNPRVTPKAGC